MADKNQDSGDRTEKPTPKRLRDARRDGDVPKSRELTSTALVLAWLLMVMLGMPMIHARLDGLFNTVMQDFNQPFGRALHHAGVKTLEVFLWLTVPFLLGAMAIGVLVEFLQVGPVFAPKKVKPDASRVNPAEGMKRIFSQENLVEVIKAFAKSALLIGLFVWVLYSLIGQFVLLPYAPPEALGEAHWMAVKRL
ncbi:MAG TPA: EscU/YscU/HrcU family type III secretion system export apparatus switch protein, partial [Rhodanobacter sp.]|nr:EscU/YscU/HrcU family type III secretion system export apparatus switch protein [Rhodanobacter sp.]